MRSRHVLLPFALALTSPATLLAAQPRPIAERERGEEATLALRQTRVLVSAREVRVIFPPDAAGAWRWPTDTTADGLRYYWGISIKGIDGPRTLRLSLWGSDSAARTFPTLRSVVAAATPGLCTPGMIIRCSPTGAGATVDGTRVVLTFRDARTIRRLFGLRPDSVGVSRQLPDDPTFRPAVNVAVEYVRPQIPHPDSAFRAEAARATRRWEASITSMRRHISGGPDLGPAIRIAVGDSIPIEITESTCRHDVCDRVSRWYPISIWSVDDTALVRLNSFPLANAIREGGIADSDLPRTYLVGLAPGRTMLRARFPATARDDTSFRVPPARALEREVIVTARPDVKR